MTTFLQELQVGTGLTRTENGAVTNKSSLSNVVDFFGLAGAMRNDIPAAMELFRKAYAEDPQTAVRILFYLRDIRGGQGERDLFRAGLHALVRLNHGHLTMVAEHIPFYGRWDDVFFNGVTEGAAALVRKQLTTDREAYLADPDGPVSLLAKWMPSENTSSKATVALARQLRTELGMTSAEYRRMLSALRARIHLVEQDMSANNWPNIDYSKVPSQAHRKLARAFGRHDPNGYGAYLESVQKGESTINAGTLYPYEVYNMVKPGQSHLNESTANALWENLPDYTNGDDALVMADVSGSMSNSNGGLPMAVSVSLALYFAERNKGAFAGHFMTFSAEPQLVKVLGNTLSQRMSMIQSAHWEQNTDLSKAFQAILHAALRAGGDVPKVLYIISDMEFDQATARRSDRYGYFGTPQPQDTVFAHAKLAFQSVGLQLPHVVFWNVNAHQTQTPVTILDGRVSLVSGCSPSIFGMAVEGKSPLELVQSVVNGERYERIVL